MRLRVAGEQIFLAHDLASVENYADYFCTQQTAEKEISSELRKLIADVKMHRLPVRRQASTRAAELRGPLGSSSHI